MMHFILGYPSEELHRILVPELYIPAFQKCLRLRELILRIIWHMHMDIYPQ